MSYSSNKAFCELTFITKIFFLVVHEKLFVCDYLTKLFELVQKALLQFYLVEDLE